MRTPYPNELMHYGVMGMKWGVRRYQNSDGTLTNAGKEHYGINSNGKYSRPELKVIRNERARVKDEAYKNSKQYKEIKELEKQASELAKKYDFDQDDGGGGTTKADQAAGRKYMRLWDDIALLEDEADFEAQEKATEYIIEKYGEVAIEQLKTQDNLRAAAFVAGIWAIPITVAIVTSR